MRSKPEDPTVLECLRRLCKGAIDAGGVMADRMDEIGHPHAGRVRELWDDMIRQSEWCDNHDWSRHRKWTRWQAIATHRRQFRRKIAKLFKRRWKALPLLTYSPGPKAQPVES